MQELLSRISSLDPSAQMSLRVVACFDELIRGEVNVHALLSAGAAMAGTVAGYHDDASGREARVGPDGKSEDGNEPTNQGRTSETHDGLTVWLEKQGPLGLNDAMILERLSLSIGLRLGRSAHDTRRTLSTALDPQRPRAERAKLLSTLGLRSTAQYRVVCLPLFARWSGHPKMLEDVAHTPFGPIHVTVVESESTTVAAQPCGVGASMPLTDLDRSFRTALTCLRLCSLPDVPSVLADDYGALVELLSAEPATRPLLDVDGVDAVMARTWGASTLDAVVKTGSVRQAARIAGVHHSTMQTRIDEIQSSLGFDPLDGLGRSRVGIAYLAWRLQHSTVLSAPPTSDQQH